MFMSGVEVAPSNKGQVKFTACGFWPNRGQAYHAKLEGRGTVIFDACHFTRWDQASAGMPCIDANNARLIVTACEFATDRTDACKVGLGPNLKAAVVTSNLMTGGVLINNQTLPAADVQIGLNAGEAPKPLSQEWLVAGPFPNPKRNDVRSDRNAGVPPTVTRAGFDTDFLAPIGGETTAILIPGKSILYTDPNGAEKTATVRKVTVGPAERIDFMQLFGQGKQVAYAFCYLNSETGQTARFELGANDCSKVWINGVLRHSFWNEEGGDSTRGAYTFDAPLHKGLNTVLAKVEDAGGRKWECILEAYDAQGGPLSFEGTAQNQGNGKR
jgi:hypothetical protein